MESKEPNAHLEFAKLGRKNGEDEDRGHDRAIRIGSKTILVFKIVRSKDAELFFQQK
jgi:hypothetical protein